MTYTQDKPTALTIGCAATVIIGIFTFIYCYFHTTGVPLRVVEHNWNRKQYVEQYRTVRETGSYVPAGGRERRSWMYVHHFMKVGDTSIPVMDTMYEWDIDRWVESHYLFTSGVGTQAKWPNTSNVRIGSSIGSERLGRRVEKYWLLLNGDKGEIFTYELAEPEWLKVRDNETIMGHVNSFGVLRWFDRIE